eukprot:SAG31_NODE_1687_length_7529_cov_2.104172_1_plen_317_part_10
MRNRIVNTLGQTFAIMAGSGDIVVQASGAVDTEWEYRIRPPILKHEWAVYVADAEYENAVTYSGYNLFREVWNEVTTAMRVKIDTFNSVTADCFECVKWDGLVEKYRRAGGSSQFDRLAAQRMKQHHITVIKDGHRAAVEEFAMRSRHPDSNWRAIEFDGIDNSHTHVPYLNYSDNKGYNSMEKIKFKTTGFVEYGKGCHFWHAQPWLGAHRSVSLNMSCLLFTICAILERDGELRKNLFLHCDGGDGNWDDCQCVAMAILVQCDAVEELICHRLPVAHTHNTGDAYWSIHSTDTKAMFSIFTVICLRRLRRCDALR